MYQQPQDGQQPYYPPPPQNGQQQQYYPPPPSGQYNYPPSQQNAPQYSHNGYNHDGQNLEAPAYTTPPPAADFYNQPPYTAGQEKIKPSSGWNDVWATILWLCNLAAFIALAVIGLMTYDDNKGSYNGVQSYNQVPGLTFDTTTFLIFGLSAVVGFGISFLYIIFANL